MQDNNNQDKPKKKKTRFQRNLEEFKKEFDPENYAEEYSERFKKQLKQNEENERDKKLWNKLKAIVQKHKEDHPGETTYFSFDFIDQLGLGKIDLLLVYTGKNTGKTYALGQLATQTLYNDPDAKIFYLRTLRDHLTRAFTAQNTEDNGPWEGTPSTGELTLKKGHFIEKEGRRKKGDLVGWATYLSGDGTVSFQGPSYSNLRYLLYDEANDTGEMSEKMLRAFFIFALSLERNNPDFRIIMTGNLLTKDSGVANNAILDHFGIPIDARLKYMEEDRGEGKEPFKFLYINAGHPGELFDGTDTQRFSALFRLANKQALIDNKPLDMSKKVLDTHTFLNCEPVYAFVTDVKYEDIDGPVIVYVGLLQQLDGMVVKDYYVLRLEPFDEEYQVPKYVGNIMTDDEDISNLYGKIQLTTQEHIATIYRDLEDMAKARRLFFADSLSRHMYNKKVYKALKRKYKAMLDAKGVWF